MWGFKIYDAQDKLVETDLFVGKLGEEPTSNVPATADSPTLEFEIDPSDTLTANTIPENAIDYYTYSYKKFSFDSLNPLDWQDWEWASRDCESKGGRLAIFNEKYQDEIFTNFGTGRFYVGNGENSVLTITQEYGAYVFSLDYSTELCFDYICEWDKPAS